MNRYPYIIVFTFCCLHLSGQQLGKYEKIEKTRRDSYHFIDGTSCHRQKQKKDKSPLEVYSDQVENICYSDHLGLKKGEKQPFLKSYYVISTKGDYKELVSKSPKSLGKPKGWFSFLFSGKYNFKDVKEVDYVGWIHKDNLLEYSEPISNPVNYRPVQYITGIKDLKTLFKLRNYIKKDSVHIYLDPKLKHRAKKSLNTNQFVYVYKFNNNKSAALISNLDHMKEADSTKRIMGWIPAQLILPIGQREVIKLDWDEEIKLRHSSESLPGKEIAKSFLFQNLKPCPNNDSDSIREATLPLNIWNHYDDKLINVKGNDLLIRKIAKIKEDNNVLNFHFVFDCSAELRQKLLIQMASLQHIWLLLSEDSRFKNLKVHFTASSYGCNQFYALPKTDSFAQWIDFLQNAFLNNLPSKEANAADISKCFDFILDGSQNDVSFENNIIIIVGEKEINFPKTNHRLRSLYKELAQNSARLLFLQLESKPDNAHQNFLLQAKRILDTVGHTYTDFLKDYTVENRLAKTQNLFVNMSNEEDHIYLFDAPTNSLYNGGLVFPGIDHQLAPFSFDIAIDSLLAKTFSLNTIFLESLEKNAAELGFLNSKLSARFKNLIKKDTAFVPLIPLVPRNYVDEVFYETGKQFVMAEDDFLKTGILLTKEELGVLIQNYQAVIPILDSTARFKNRKKLYRVYKKNLRGLNKLWHYKELRIKDPMGTFISMKTGVPVQDSILNLLRVKDIRKRATLSDKKFGHLMQTLRKKTEHLETLLDESIPPYKDGGNTPYYFISKNDLL